jgi:beta-glucosidase
MYDVFSLKDIKLPKDFLWGSSTAGHQIEGGNIHSQLWKQELEGKFETPSGKACNSYELYDEDTKILKDFGHQGYRMSIEWSRIEPFEGQYNNEAIEHYVRQLNGLCESGIKPFVTLHHFSHPEWFEKLGAFNKEENNIHFLRYIEKIVPLISQYVSGWNVINEFNLHFGVDPVRDMFKMNMLRVHALGYHIIKKYSIAPVSTAHAYGSYFPLRQYDKADKLMAEYKDFIVNEFFFHAIRTGEVIMPFNDAIYIPELKNSVDFWSVNYYTRTMVDARKANTVGKRFDHKELKMIKKDFSIEEFYPEGLTFALERLKDKPIIISENGCCCDNDDFRIVYLALHLSAIKEAIDLGADVKGYFYWSLLDNFEWGSYIPRFGLIDVDFETFKRTPKNSASFYKEIIENNGFSQEILRKYLEGHPSLKRGKHNEY